jgi:hypothetical protein
MSRAGGVGVDTEAWWRRLPAESEMVQRVLEHDWASTPLGPIDTWSHSLRGAVGICLASRFPMLVVWGPDLIKIYNDAYRPMLGSRKHPHALGAPAAEIWPEAWHVIGPLFDDVLRTGAATWHEAGLLEIDRHGFLEECYFTWSYSPIFDDDGTIAGVFDTATEVTEQVISTRRLACLSQLATELFDCTDVAEVCRRSVAVLASCAGDIPAADLYLDAGGELVLIASTRRRGPATRADTDELLGVLVSGQVLATGGTVTPGGHRVGVELCAPLGNGASHDLPGVVVFETPPGRPFDDEAKDFLDLVAGSIAASLAAAFRRTAELGTHRQISTSLQGAMLSAVDETPTLAVRYLPAVGSLSVGGDWYDVFDLPDGRQALVVGDCVGHGLDAATRMGQLRSASRVLLMEGHGPADTLERLSVFAESIEGAECTTVCCVVVDPATGDATYASAGHLPPLLWAGGEGRWLSEGRSRPLGIGRPSRVESSVRMGPSDRLLLYTDGLVERRGELIDVGMDRLIARMADIGDASSAAVVADVLLTEVPVADARDDVALLVYGLPHALGPEAQNSEV